MSRGASCLYTRISSSEYSVLVAYADDMVIVSKTQHGVCKIIKDLKTALGKRISASHNEMIDT